jgi:murein DD-endopeptidase MepM/ murein hydrolase activator NlpD
MRPFLLLMIGLLLISCSSPTTASLPPTATPEPPATQPIATEHAPASSLIPTPLPTRTRWDFGEALPYSIQSGDTLYTIAIHFNTTIEAIRQLNPGITYGDLTILPPGEPLNIPANYVPLMGPSYKIIPDSELIYSPGQSNFALKSTIMEYNGFLSRYADYVDEKMRPSWEVIELVARDYSINPRLLLALVEYRSGALTRQGVSDFTYPLGHTDPLKSGLYKQLVWAATILSQGYYDWRYGNLVEVMTKDGALERLDFWQNAGTVALHKLFAELMTADEFSKAISPDGLGTTYTQLFGDPFKYEVTLYPAYTQQPTLELPFQPGRVWSFTGGPHPAWGEGNDTPWAAVDLAPPAVGIGCGYSSEWVTAMADGVIARSQEAAVVLDLDGDGNEHTGWVVFYYHMSLDALPPVGKQVKLGDPLGHGSCDGGLATGTHVHVARRFNGEWIPTDGPLPFVMSNWTVHTGSEAYLGTLTFDLPAMEITACLCVTSANEFSR